MLITYYLTPIKYRNITLLMGSYLFYSAGEPVYSLLLIVSTIVDYSHSLIISRNHGTRKAKMALISSIVLNLSMLLFFKYADFAITTVNALFGSDLNLLNVRLPIGISFFTFQTMSYTIDVYRREADAQTNPFDLATYVALFPQLIAGPIVRYKTIAKELNNRKHNTTLFGYGVHRFIIGLGKKVLLANTLGELAVQAQTTTTPSVLFYWVGALAFALQIYYDFSGYSDMAIGLGRMLGFHFQENFNHPYISRSISEFWNRWHMSLGAWFKDYVYIPLGGNRKGKAKWIRNIAIVWLLTGFWHGASWNFVIWGAYLGTFIILEKLFLLKWLEKVPRALSHLYVTFIIVVSFVVFNNESFAVMSTYLKGMFGLSNVPLSSHDALYYTNSNLTLLVIGCLFATPISSVIKNQIMPKMPLTLLTKTPSAILAPIFHVTLLTIITGYLVDASFNPFLYFRF